jgi:hypothetical protein
MKTLFKMDNNHQMTDVPNEGTEGVFAGDWVPRIKLDGTACAVIKGRLYKRYDCKLNKKGVRKTPPIDWAPCDLTPDPITNHWPGWTPVTFVDKHHVDAWVNHWDNTYREDGTFELIGSKVQNNPYNLVKFHALVPHKYCRVVSLTMPMSYESLKNDIEKLTEEGIVFHGPDEQYFKLRRTDFGFAWPVA